MFDIGLIILDFRCTFVQDMLERKWRSYLKEQVSLTAGMHDVGSYWNVEKTPSSVLSRKVADLVNMLTPSIRLILMIRNPTVRALSAFVMYTRHINNFNAFKTTWDVNDAMYSSYVIRNLNTGEVKFAKFGGVGGTIAKRSQLKFIDRNSTDRWRFISFPPSPQDFHDFLLTNRNITDKYGPFHFDSRQSRVVQEGYYVRYIRKWLEVFPSRQFLVIPMESLWNNETIENMNFLQRKLGIPLFDYKKVTYFDKETKRYELQSASTHLLWSIFNVGSDAVSMLPQSRKLLDDLYCKSNQQLKRMIPELNLKGYSCI